MSLVSEKDRNEFGLADLSPTTIEHAGELASKGWVRLTQNQALLDKLYALRRELRHELEVANDRESILLNIKASKVLTEKLEEIEEESQALRWAAIDALGTLSFSETAAIRLFSIQAEVGNAVATLSSLGLGLSLSILYGAERGNVMPIYESFWCFMASLTSVAGLAILGAAKKSDPASQSPTKRNWLIRTASMLAILFSYWTGLAGLTFLGIAGVEFDVADEVLNNVEARLYGGPVQTGRGATKQVRILTYTGGAGFACLLGLGLIIALHPKLHLPKPRRRDLRERYFIKQEHVERRHHTYSGS